MKNCPITVASLRSLQAPLRWAARFTLCIALVVLFAGKGTSAQGGPTPVFVGEAEQEKMRVAGSAAADPPLAVAARIEGVVRLQFTVTTEGSVKDLEVLSGHPLLQQSALNAVETYRYTPMLRE